MDDPEIVAELNRVKNTERITAMAQRDFKHAAIHTFEWLGLVRLATLGGDSQRPKCVFAHIGGKQFEITAGGFELGDLTGETHSVC